MGTGIFAVEQKNKVLCFNYLCAHRPLDCPQILRRRRLVESLSGEGELLGTVPYMSPEQVRGENLDIRTDLFSLGVTLYEMASGRRPFEAATVPGVFDAILHSTPRAIPALQPGFPQKVASIIDTAMQKERDGRQQSAASPHFSRDLR